MYNATLVDGKIQTNASDLIDELVFMKTGKCPYLHFDKQYGIKQIGLKEYSDACQWVQEHFIFINPKERKYSSLLDNFKFWFDVYQFQGALIDPFKNIDHNEEAGGRFDLYLDRLFSDTKLFSLETNCSFNIIAHPRNDKDPKNPDGSYKLCSQFALAGGAAWNNNMDGIFSIRRPWKHKNPDDPRVEFFNLKQRKQQLVGRCGVYDKIEFNFTTNRYYFDGYEPIEGHYVEPIDVKHKREEKARKEAAAEGAEKKPKKSTVQKVTEAKHEQQLAAADQIPFTEVVNKDLIEDQREEDVPLF